MWCFSGLYSFTNLVQFGGGFVNSLAPKIQLDAPLPIPLAVEVNNAVYADDLAVFAVNRHIAQLANDAVEVFNNTTNMDLNIIKSAVQLTQQHLPGKRHSSNPHLTYANQPFTGLEKSTDQYKYMGVESGGNGSARNTLKRLIDDILNPFGEKIMAAVCPNWMKTYFFTTMVLPKALFTLESIPLKPTQYEKLNIVARRWIRNFEQKRSSFSNAAIHAPVDFGGFGCPNFAIAGPLRFTTNFLLRSFLSDPHIKTSQWELLYRECARLHSLHPSNSTTDILLNPRLFSTLADEFTPLDLSVPLLALAEAEVHFTQTPTLSIHSDDPNVDLPTRIRRATARLKDIARCQHYSNWFDQTLQGETLQANSPHDLAPRSANCVWQTRPSYFSTEQRKFAQDLQTQSINCHYNLHMWNPSFPKSCPFCHASTESVRHVFNACKPRLPFYKDRHDAALDILTSHLKKKFPTAVMSIDQVADRKISSCTLRPDVVLIHNGTVQIIDMKVPFPIGDFVDRTHSLNVAKYTPLLNKFVQKRKLDPTKSSVNTIIIPSTGPNKIHSFSIKINWFHSQ